MGLPSLLSIPLSSGEEVVGVIDVFDSRERDYGEYLDFLRSVGQTVAAAMRNAWLLTELTDAEPRARRARRPRPPRHGHDGHTDVAPCAHASA